MDNDDEGMDAGRPARDPRTSADVMTHPLLAVVAECHGGILSKGKHTGDPAHACIMEASAEARGRGITERTDSPALAGLPDARRINDGPWSSDAARTKALLALGVALWDWPTWTDAQRTDWARGVALRTIREVLPIALDAAGLPDHATACRDAPDLAASWSARSAASAASAAESAVESAWSASESAASAASAVESAWSAASAGWSASESAASAAWSAAWSAASAASAGRSADDVLRLACSIWVDEARRVSA